MMTDKDTQEEATANKSQIKLNIQFGSAVIAFLFILIASFFTGKLIGSNSINSTKLASVKHNKDLEIELTHTHNRLTMAETTNKIHTEALEQTRQTILELEQQIYQQQKQIISYKSIISKQKPAYNLVIRDLIIHATSDPLAFKYKLVLTRIDQATLLLTGNLQITIEGTLNNKNKILPLAEVTTFPEHKKVIPYSFRYMEMIPENNQFAELLLPKGFIPKKLKITAYPDATKKPFSKEFKWSVDPLPQAPSTE